MAGPEQQNQKLAKIINSNLGHGRQLSQSKFLSQSLIKSANSTNLISRQLPELLSEGCDVKFQLVQANSANKMKTAMANSANPADRVSSSNRRSSLPLVPRHMDLLDYDQQKLGYGELEQHASAVNRRMSTQYGLNSSSGRDYAHNGYEDVDDELVPDRVQHKEKFKKLDHLKFKKTQSSTPTTTATPPPSSTVIVDTARACRVCGREFPSGRALGGHMRIHGASAMASISAGSTELQVNGGSSAVQVNNMQERENLMQLATATEHQEKQEAAGARLGSTRVKQESEGNGDGGSESNINFNDKNSSVSKFREREGSMLKMKEFKLISGAPAGAHKVSKKHRKMEDDEEDEEGVDPNESFDCTSPVDHQKPELASDEAEMVHLGDGDVSSVSHELLSKRHSSSSAAPALYELRRNPKPNRRFVRDQEAGTASVSANNGACNSQLSNTSCAAMAPNTGANDNSMTGRSTGGLKSANPPPPELNNQDQKHQQQQTQAHPCSECGKLFSSWKALFGHMRCHPEREWRGIQKPGSADATRSSMNNRRYSAVQPSNSSTVNAAAADHPVEKDQNKSTTRISVSNSCTNVARESHGNNASADAQLGKASPKSEAHVSEDNLHAGIKRTADMAFGSADIAADNNTRSPVWPTRKRSKRRPVSLLVQPSVLTSDSSTSMEKEDNISTKDQEDLDMAKWLVLLSSSDPMCTETGTEDQTAFSHNSEGGFVKHSATASEDDADGGEDDEDYDDEVEARNHGADDECENYDSIAGDNYNSSTKYQCSTCKKCFSSHQALGGHRASHKKTKGCFAQTKSTDDIDVAHDQINASIKESPKLQHITDDNFLSSEKCTWKTMRQLACGSAATSSPSAEKEVANSPVIDAELVASKTYSSSKKKFKGHECSICHRIFPSGQALGGHKRCHWTGDQKMAGDTASVASSNNNSSSCKNSDQKMDDWEGRTTAGSTMQRRMMSTREDAMLDLNLPAPLDLDDEEDIENLHNAMYGIKPSGNEQQKMHGSPLVECNQAANTGPDQVKDWSVKDLLGATGDASLLEVAREIEVRYRFPPAQVWSDQWTNAVSVAQLPQVCTMQPLI